MPLESTPKFWSLVQKLKTLSQNTFVTGWSFSLQFHLSLISSLQLTSECHRGMGLCMDQQPHPYFTCRLRRDSACWIDQQKLLRYSNGLLLGIIPKQEEEKSSKVFISGSRMKRIPYRCNKMLQEHNSFWVLICFSAAVAGRKGVNILVNVSVPCTPCGGPAWNTREQRVHTPKGNNKLTTSILSWKTAFHNCAQLQHTPWFSFQYGCQSVLGNLGFHFPTLH